MLCLVARHPKKIVSLNLCAVMYILLLYILSRFTCSEQKCYFLYKGLQNFNLCVSTTHSSMSLLCQIFGAFIQSVSFQFDIFVVPKLVVVMLEVGKTDTPHD